MILFSKKKRKENKICYLIEGCHFFFFFWSCQLSLCSSCFGWTLWPLFGMELSYHVILEKDNGETVHVVLSFETASSVTLATLREKLGIRDKEVELQLHNHAFGGFQTLKTEKDIAILQNNSQFKILKKKGKKELKEQKEKEKQEAKEKKKQEKLKKEKEAKETKKR